jgi:CxxC-x17-CxxC domain-containing protein
MIEEVRDAVFGNVGTIILFRVGAEDALFLEKEFLPAFTSEDLVNLGKYHIYIKLMIDGVTGHPFSAITLPPYPKPKVSYRKEIIASSEKKYGVPKEQIEREIKEWMEVDSKGKEPPAPPPELYDAICFRCGKKIKVPFLPDPERPVYCKSCLKKMEKEEVIEETPSVSLESLIKTEPVSLKKKKEEEKEKEEKKVDINIEELKNTLAKILAKEKEKEEKTKKSEENKNKKNSENKGILKPGEKVQF